MLAAHPPVARQKDGVAFDVAVDDALVVQVGQGSQDRQADGRYLLLVHPETARWKNEVSINEDRGNGSWSEEEQAPLHARMQPARRSFRQRLCGVMLWSCFLSTKGR